MREEITDPLPFPQAKTPFHAKTLTIGSKGSNSRFFTKCYLLAAAMLPRLGHGSDGETPNHTNLFRELTQRGRQPQALERFI